MTWAAVSHVRLFTAYRPLAAASTRQEIPFPGSSAYAVLGSGNPIDERERQPRRQRQRGDDHRAHAPRRPDEIRDRRRIHDDIESGRVTNDNDPHSTAHASFDSPDPPKTSPSRTLQRSGTQEASRDPTTCSRQRLCTTGGRGPGAAPSMPHRAIRRSPRPVPRRTDRGRQGDAGIEHLACHPRCPGHQEHPERMYRLDALGDVPAQTVSIQEVVDRPERDGTHRQPPRR